MVPSNWLSEVFTFKWLDQKIIDGIIHGVARGTWSLGVAVRRWIDLNVVNWLGDRLGDGTRGSARELQVLQTGRIQQYLLLTVLAVVIVGAIFYYIISTLA